MDVPRIGRVEREAIAGTLRASAPSGAGKSIRLHNFLPLPVSIAVVDSDGVTDKTATIDHDKELSVDDVKDGYFVSVFTANTGAFVAVIEVVKEHTKYSIKGTLLTSPNEIGPPPIPKQNDWIPPDSPPVLVGAGKAGNDIVVTREQFWAKTPSSYSLAPLESRSISLQQVHGRQDTSSDATSVSKSIGASASGGWGPISASVNATLSQDHVTTHQVQITEQTTNSAVQTLTNASKDKSQVVLVWQLQDRITWWKGETDPKVEASVTLGVTPVVPIAATIADTDIQLNGAGDTSGRATSSARSGRPKKVAATKKVASARKVAATRKRAQGRR